MARLIAFAATDERIGAIMRKATHTVQAGKRTIKCRQHQSSRPEWRVRRPRWQDRLHHQLRLLHRQPLRLPQTGQQVAVVVLGAKSNQGRFWETRHLFNWMTSHAQKLLGIVPQPPVPPIGGPGALRLALQVTSYKFKTAAPLGAASRYLDLYRSTRTTCNS